MYRDAHRAAANLTILHHRAIARRQVNGSAEDLAAPGTLDFDEFAQRAARLGARLEDRLQAVESIHIAPDQGAPCAPQAYRRSSVLESSSSWSVSIDPPRLDATAPE